MAGNVGAAERYEFTVIGDPVNEASRLTEQAKHHDERVLASDGVIERAGAEGEHWREVGGVVLRGRVEETRLSVPVVAPS